eukprot:TRINITY_DN29725_c0_g1_i1.p1 TRINITY_DN29725_c0_g1~~TRINITY_DN29725_c0_g1_i1.p1  ORF type:complete len:338 (+),score=52.41 TRINITY_DN29725_c0_g1_i1:47-1015(+)
MSTKARREFRANLIASAATGGSIMLVTNPLDTLRCRWQVSDVAGQTLPRFLASLVRSEGLWTGLWRPGLPPNVVALSLAIGGRNGFYPSFRDGIGALQGSGEKVGPQGMFVAGLLAGMAGYFVASPLLQVKTQMQAEAGKLGADGLYLTGARRGLPPTYASSLGALSQLAAEGSAAGGPVGAARSLWRGSGVIVGRGAAVAASQMSAYDWTKTFLKARGFEDGPLLHFLASQVGAVCCTTFSMPFDVVLTVYTSSTTIGGERAALYGASGPLGCAAAMLRRDGPRAFFRGWVPALLRISPTTTLSFSCYEQLRRLVGIGYLD